MASNAKSGVKSPVLQPSTRRRREGTDMAEKKNKREGERTRLKTDNILESNSLPLLTTLQVQRSPISNTTNMVQLNIME